MTFINENLNYTPDTILTTGKYKDMKNEIEVSVDQVEELLNFLAVGELPDGIKMPHPPKLGYHKAMSVIWFLQEHTGIIPDTFEMCAECKRMIDTNSEGEYSEKTFKHYCDGCANNRRHRGQRI